jgi:hypothetical protein
MYDERGISTYEVTLTFDIRQFGYVAGEPIYDWINNRGEESDSTFDSKADALADIKLRYG